MRLILLLFFTLAFSLCFGQTDVAGDTIKPGMCDTVNIEIRSKIAFPFCGNLYDLPRDCNKNYPRDCCDYSTSIRKNVKVADWGYVSCGNGSMFSWHYTNSLEYAKAGVENIPGQWEKQSKKFSKKNIKCFIYDTEVDAFLIEQQSLEGYTFFILLAYGSHNGFNFYLEYNTSKKIETTNDIQPAFRQILRIK